MSEGQTIGNYQILRLLGEGGMGRVYLARQVVLDREVVLKRIRPELATNPDVVRRFLVEARAAAQLVHRNIVVVHDSGTDAEGVPYIALEYLDGISLRRWLEDRRPVMGAFVSPALVALIAAQAGAALAFAHERGIVHRDIKPDNVMLVRAPIELRGALARNRLPVELFVKVLDFGIAKLAGQPGQGGTGTHVALGTPAYMPPEQLTGARDVDARADVYALGAMFYEMLSGDVPWGTTTFAELHGRMMHEPTPDPRRLNPGVPKRVAQVVMQALKREPDDRWPSVAAFVRAFCAEAPPADGLPSGLELLQVFASELSDPGSVVPPAQVGPSTEQQPGASRAAMVPSITPQSAVIATTPPVRSRRGLAISLGAAAAVGVTVVAVALGGGGSSTTSGGAAATPTAAPVAPAPAPAEPMLDAAVADTSPQDASAVVDLPVAPVPPLDAGTIDAPRHRNRPASDPRGTGSGSSHGIRVIN